jgi:hypothetical protein
VAAAGWTALGGVAPRDVRVTLVWGHGRVRVELQNARVAGSRTVEAFRRLGVARTHQWRLGRAGRSATARHRGENGWPTAPIDGGGLGRLTGHSYWPRTQQGGRSREVALMAAADPDLGKSEEQGEKEGKGETVGEMVWSGSRRSLRSEGRARLEAGGGLFIGAPWRSPVA